MEFLCVCLTLSGLRQKRFRINKPRLHARYPHEDNLHRLRQLWSITAIDRSKSNFFVCSLATSFFFHSSGDARQDRRNSGRRTVEILWKIEFFSRRGKTKFHATRRRKGSRGIFGLKKEKGKREKNEKRKINGHHAGMFYASPCGRKRNCSWTLLSDSGGWVGVCILRIRQIYGSQRRKLRINIAG